MHYEVSVVVKVPRDKVYSAYTDFEAMPKWSRQRVAVKVSRRDGNTVFLERASGGDGGSLAIWEMNLFPPERVESGTDSKLRRTKSVVRFEEVSEGTKVTAALDVQLKGRWSWIFRPRGRAEAESQAAEELESFARYVEGLA